VEQRNASSPRPATVYLPNGVTLGDRTPSGPELDAARAGRAFNASVPGGIAVFVPVRDATGTAVIRVVVPDEQLRRGVHRAWLLLGVVATSLLGLAVLLADRLGRSIVRPVEALRRVTERLREGDRSARATGEGPHEVAEVGREVNRLADRIEDLLRTEREATADLSHRLRTPLTALRLDIDGLPAGPEQTRLVGEVDELEAAVDRLIRAAREVKPPASATTDLSAATRARLLFWSVLAQDQARPVGVELPLEPVRVALRSENLDAAIDAIVGNVFTHTPERTAFRVEVAVDGSTVTLAVSDDGPGFVDSSVDRGQSSAGSTGLGLDIARRTAEAIGGRLVLRRASGGGARVEVTLPLAPLQPSPPC
jgi:signal transduction histidine kinase